MMTKENLDAPGLEKWPFVLGDLLCLGAAAVLGMWVPLPWGWEVLVLMGVLVMLGAGILVAPFLVEFSRREAAEEAERLRLAERVAKMSLEASERMGVMVSGLEELRGGGGDEGNAGERLERLEAGLQGLGEELREGVKGILERVEKVEGKIGKEVRGQVLELRGEVGGVSEKVLKGGCGPAVAGLVAELRELKKQVGELGGEVGGMKEELKREERVVEVPVARERRREAGKLMKRAGVAVAAEEVPAVERLEALMAKGGENAGDRIGETGELKSDAERREGEGDGVETGMRISVPVEEAGAEQRSDVRGQMSEGGAQGAEREEAGAVELPVAEAQGVVEEKEEVLEVQEEDAGGEEGDVVVEEKVEEVPVMEKLIGEEAVEAPVVVVEKKERKARVKREKSNEVEPGLDLGDIEGEAPKVARSEIGAGEMRLLVTAYVGIGSRLCLRGEGAGLSWEKGVPLKFISIGKWGWDAKGVEGPVRAKVYKNDEAECVTLGEFEIRDGFLNEVSAQW